jgi:hypothetical protein
MNAIAVFAAFDNPVLHGRSNQNCYCKPHEKLSEAGEKPRRLSQVSEGLLKNAVQLKSEKHLRSQNQEAGLV